MADNRMVCPRCWGSGAEPGKRDKKCSYCGGPGSVPDMQLSPHFKLSEMLASQTAVRKGIPNDPSDLQVSKLAAVALMLERVRDEFGTINVTSGLRLPALNAAIGGSSKTSAHQHGLAVDFVTRKASLGKVTKWAVSKNGVIHLVDQWIFEGAWLHLGVESPFGKKRNQALMMFGGTYFPLDLKDPRVV